MFSCFCLFLKNPLISSIPAAASARHDQTADACSSGMDLVTKPLASEHPALEGSAVDLDISSLLY